MAVEHGLDNLKNDVTSQRLGHAPVFLDHVQQFAAHAGLHDHDELLAVDERLMQLYDVLMCKRLQAFCLFVDRLNEVG